MDILDILSNMPSTDTALLDISHGTFQIKQNNAIFLYYVPDFTL